MRHHLLATIAVSSLVLSPLALASGGGGFNQSGFSSKRIDQQYELGKSYYKGAQANGSQIEYCVKKGESLSKLGRRSVRSFKNGPASNFVDSLYSCSDPTLKIADTVDDEQGQAILYYLNKRFKLRLQ